jgi:predicted phosphodiesterase
MPYPMIARRSVLKLLGAGVIASPVPSCAPPAPSEPFTRLKGPWVHFMSPSTAILRFETSEDVEAAVFLEGPGGRFIAFTERSIATLDLAWGEPVGEVIPDENGDHVLHSVVLEGLAPNSEITWEIRPSPDEVVQGSFRTSPSVDDPVRIGWIADTMFPISAEIAATLAAHEPQLVVHGGDVQYRQSPFCTWNSFFSAMTPLTRQAAVHVCFGNHEVDDPLEPEQYFERLFAGQGGSGHARFHAVEWGGLVFVCLDSESGGLEDPSSPQGRWARQVLTDATDRGLRPILAMHHPMYTLSKHAPLDDLALREQVHALATEFGCKLVLSGHTHGHEHFEVDGVHYWVDGGGGALLYDLDEFAEDVVARRPDEPLLRQRHDRSFGATVIDYANGYLELTRIDRDGTPSDIVEIALT